MLLIARQSRSKILILSSLGFLPEVASKMLKKVFHDASNEKQEDPHSRCTSTDNARRQTELGHRRHRRLLCFRSDRRRAVCVLRRISFGYYFIEPYEEIAQNIFPGNCPASGCLSPNFRRR